MTESDNLIKLVENTKPEKPVKWSAVKKILASKEPKELLALIKDLYSLNKQNKTFLHTKYTLVDPVKPYMEIIAECISLDYKKPINLAGAKKAISQYRKAVGDPKGILELMVFYVECGNDLTCEYGDIDEKFYCSLESVFHNALQALAKSDIETIEEYLPRLQTIVEKAENIGWGYYDTIIELLYDYFPPE
jgi:hypothetical protein